MLFIARSFHRARCVRSTPCRPRPTTRRIPTPKFPTRSFGSWKFPKVSVLNLPPAVPISRTTSKPLRCLYATQPTSEKTAMLIDACHRGDLERVKQLVAEGVDVNQGDYDRRTPMHLAAADGNLEVVKFLVEHNANVNVIDRFGHSPLYDALRGGKTQIVQYLESVGAITTRDIDKLLSMSDFRAAVQQSLMLICEQENWDYAEAWIPDDSGQQFTSTEWFAEQNVITKFAQLRKDMESVPAEPLITKAVETRRPILLDPITKESFGPRYDLALSLGVKSSLVIPIIHDEKLMAVYMFLSTKPMQLTPAEVEDISTLALGLLCSGLFDKPFFVPVPGVPVGQQETVYRYAVEEGVFNSQIVFQEVNNYYKLGLQQYYWEHFSPAEIASHIHSFIAAKKLAQTTGRPEEINYHVVAPDGTSGFYLSNSDHKSIVQTEDLVIRQIESLPRDKAFSYHSFISDNTILPGGTKKLHVAVLTTPQWISEDTSSNQKDLNKVGTTDLLRKPAAMRERYQEIINDAVGKLSPTFRVFPTYRDGTIPIMMCFKRADGTCYLNLITELLKYNNMQVKRKFIETFSNGLIVYSLYLYPTPREAIDQFLNQMSLVVAAPPSQFTTLFLDGMLSAEEYAFSNSMTFFVYYFTHQKIEEFEILAKSFKNDPLNLGRLKSLQLKMKREAVTKKRIHDAIINNVDLTRSIYKEFEKKCHNLPTDLESLRSKIQKTITNETDEMILLTMVTFVEHVLKTNFYSSKKCTLSYRLDPRFLYGHYPQVPYAVFMVTGYEFHGFHVRFDDIARGGVRLIRSASDAAYSRNFETLFQENYNLALTQHMKNKDIPEAGSKGTVLLSRAHQANAEIAFQKYVSGLMDLMIPKVGVFDAYKKMEVLFLGPDEGTADYMDWAADYARRRGYKYWKSFTTGKPPSMGGIPHDLFGMTTRSVHTYVLCCLRKAGLREEDVTKVQTGGPDGDLGSNEILISKDKTIAVIDGSGVAYDPKGLDREELTRLARARVMIKEFDRSKLSKDGFIVLVTDRDVRLPNGEFVESGLQFRNNFHLHPLCKADLFVPCGGRPESINLSNVYKLLDDKGKPLFRFIVEGANLFLTQDARMVLEDAGVVLFKDASANKGGVTSSSLEVLAALAMTDEEFSQHMMVTGAEYPAFYQAYVEEIQRRIQENAELEFECIWREHEATGKHRCMLTDELSVKINQLNQAIKHSKLWENKELRKLVLSKAIPQELQKLLSIDTIIQRIPETYAKAIFGSYLAAQFVYKHGLSASEFAFFEFMTSLLAEAGVYHL